MIGGGGGVVVNLELAIWQVSLRISKGIVVAYRPTCSGLSKIFAISTVAFWCQSSGNFSTAMLVSTTKVGILLSVRLNFSCCLSLGLAHKLKEAWKIHM